MVKVICSKCLESKEKSQFYKNKRSVHGRQYWCILCMRAANSLRREVLRGEKLTNLNVKVPINYKILMKRFARDEKETISKAVVRALTMFILNEMEQEGFNDVEAYIRYLDSAGEVKVETVAKIDTRADAVALVDSLLAQK